MATNNSKSSASKEPLTSVGTAEMKDDGTLWLRFHTSESGLHGQSLKIVKPTDPDYQTHLNHIGPITPGEYKNLPPYI